MGGSGNTSLSSGFSLIIALKCLFMTVLILGKRGLKSKSPIILFDFNPFCFYKKFSKNGLVSEKKIKKKFP